MTRQLSLDTVEAFSRSLTERCETMCLYLI